MIPTTPGTYILSLQCSRACKINVGGLGKLQLCPGYYLYVGTEFGPGGLCARIGHHRKRALYPHWHVDYLRRFTRLESVWYSCGARCEYEWAAEVDAMPGATPALSRFGSSDCRCGTHLYWFAEPPLALSCTLRGGATLAG